LVAASNVVILALPAVVAPAPAMAGDAAAKLAPHRAVYDLKLARTRVKSALTGLSGRMVLEFNGSSCEGYTLNMRVVTRNSVASGRSELTDTRSTSWESGDGRTLRFGSWQYKNQKLAVAFEGRASRGEGGDPGIASFTRPKKENYPLGPKTIFPVEHMREIMAAAFAGKMLVKSEVFDGGDGKKKFAVTGFIGKRREPGKSPVPADLEAAQGLNKMASWSVNLSYFKIVEKQVGEQTPDHVTRFVVFEDGVSTQLELDYGAFAVSGKLTALEYLKPTKC